MTTENREQIVKALKCCASSSLEDCDNCPIEKQKKDNCECGRYLAIQALVLIREQDEEIERLKELGTTKEIEKEIVRRETKADTARRLQARLKAEFKDCCRYIQGNREYFIVGEELIDQIIEELLEGV